MKYIDQSGAGNTLLILTDAESRQLRLVLDLLQKEGVVMPAGEFRAAREAFNRGLLRGTAKMQEEEKANWKARKK